MRTKLERFAIGLMLAPVATLAGLLICWWAAYTLLPEKLIIFAAIAGLCVGILVDILFLQELLEHRLGWPLWMAVYLFYSTCLFGFFMGVPIFNAALAVPAGFIVGNRLAEDKADNPRVRKVAQHTAWFTTGVLALVCAASAIIALMSTSTASDLTGMLHLDFKVTQAMIIGLILVGGTALLAVCWVLTIFCVRLTHHLLSS